MQLEDYRPVNIEFDVANSSIVPDNLGQYENSQKAFEFISKNIVGINQKVTVNRFMDHVEKIELRKEYSDLLENKLPILERELMKESSVFEQAKKDLADAKEYVNATTNECKALAMEVKRGVKEITLDDLFTWRVPFEGRYYFFTFIDNQIKLCKLSDIPEHEKMDLYNAMNQNDEFFNTNFGVKESE